MGIRVERSSVKVTPTADPNVYMVTAEVTTDPDTIKDPVLRTYTVKWNKNSGWAALKTMFQEQISTDTSAQAIEETIKNAVGEDIRSSQEEEPNNDTPQEVIINAATVTVNQVG